MLRYLFPSIVWTIFVIFLSVIPGSSIDFNIAFPGVDKFVHFFMYLFLTLFWSTGLKRQNIVLPLKKHAFRLSILGGFSLGFLLECIQHFFVPFRYFEGLDLIANGIGCIFGVIIFKIIYQQYARI